MVKEQSLSVLIKKLDDVFSEFIRLRDAEPFTGIVSCFVTGERVHWRLADAAHYVDRRHLSVRWDEMNVHSTTVFSNRFDEFHHYRYQKKMYDAYGVQKIYGLEAKGKSLVKPTRGELSELIETYKEKVKELRKQKHL